MAFKINPEDVPEELQNRADTEFSAWYDGPVIDVSGIINAAIEAGLVSPPCWAVTRPGSQITWGPLSLEQAKRMVLRGEVIEHWKGQTE